jgi:hypothetical protein
MVKFSVKNGIGAFNRINVYYLYYILDTLLTKQHITSFKF